MRKTHAFCHCECDNTAIHESKKMGCHENPTDLQGSQTNLTMTNRSGLLCANL